MRHTILIVDDDAALVEIMTVFLRSEDYEVFAVDSAPAAMSVIQEESLSGLIIDSSPGLRGLDVVKIFRKKNPLGAIIFFTGLAYDDTSETALEAGANAVLFKPVGLEKIASALRRFLAKTA
jgi:two-component system, OmpR family, response regulator MtrA